MTHPNSSDDAALANALRSLYLAEVERAARDPQKALVSVRGNVRARTPGWSLLGVAAVVSVLVVAAVSAQLGHGLPSISGSKGGPPGSASLTNEPAPSSPVGSGPQFGPLVGGVPETINGERVLVGSAALDAFQRSTDDSSILVGGWLDGSRTFLLWDSKCTGDALLSRPMTGTTQVGFARGPSSSPLPIVADSSVLPIVLRVHTHDTSCARGPRVDSAHLAVLDEVVWKGSVEPMPSPATSQPPSGVSRQDAIAKAVHFSRQYSSISPRAVSVVDGPYLTVAFRGDIIPGDQWVWAITVAGSFPAPDCAPFDPGIPPCQPSVKTQLVVLDYETGSVLLAEAPAP